MMLTTQKKMTTLTQAELYDLTRDLKLSKNPVQLLGLRLIEKQLLGQEQRSTGIETVREN